MQALGIIGEDTSSTNDRTGAQQLNVMSQQEVQHEWCTPTECAPMRTAMTTMTMRGSGKGAHPTRQHGSNDDIVVV